MSSASPAYDQRMSSAWVEYEQRMMTWWMRKVMMTFQVPRELLPSQQSSKQATLNRLTHCAPVQHRPSDRSAPLHHQSPSSISHLPPCGDTCLQHYHCGIHSLWSACMGQYDQQSFQHLRQHDASSSSTNSAAAATYSTTTTILVSTVLG